MGALLELGAGFHPEYTGREKISNSLLRCRTDWRGGRRQAMKSSLADIGESTLMRRSRPIRAAWWCAFGFALVTALPDLLITDEVLAVGDESWEQMHCVDGALPRGRRHAAAGILHSL